MWIDTRLKERVTASWQFKSLIWDISSRFPLANHFDLPGSESVFGVSQGPPMCACASLSQDGFYQRGLWVDSITYNGVTPPPFCIGPQRTNSNCLLQGPIYLLPQLDHSKSSQFYIQLIILILDLSSHRHINYFHVHNTSMK